MLLSAIVRLTLLSAIAPPSGDTTYIIARDGSVVSADTVAAAIPDEPQIAKWPDKRVYRPGEEVLVAAHFTGGGYVVDHRVGDTSPLPEVLAWTDRHQYAVGDEATVYVQTGHVAGYVMVFQVDDDGIGHLLFPRTPFHDNYLPADETIALSAPGETGTFAVTSATGTGLLYAVISKDHFDLEQFLDGNGWRSDAIKIHSSPSEATTTHWGRLFWEMTAVTKGVTNGPFSSHLLSYGVVNPRVARRRLFVPQTVLQCRDSYSYYDSDWCPGDPTKQIPCVILSDGMVLFGDACAWYEFSLQFAADRAAWCAETHNPISCAGLPPGDSGTKTASATPPTHHLGAPFGPKAISKDESPSALNHLGSAFRPAATPPPAEPPTYATGIFRKKGNASPPDLRDPFAPTSRGSPPNPPRSGGAATPHAVDPGFAPPSTVAQRPEPPRKTGGTDQAPQWKDRSSADSRQSSGGGNYDPPQSTGGISYDPSPSSGGGGGVSRPDPSPPSQPPSQPPSYSPPDHTNAGNPPGSPPPAPGRPPAD